MNVLWLQSGGCGGCSMSLLCAESPDLLLTLEGAGIRLLWHPSLSEESGKEFLDILNACLEGKILLDVLCMEGAMLRGPKGSGRFHVLAGTGIAMVEWVKRLAGVANHVLAIGTCAAYGGVSSAGENHVEACGLQYEGFDKGGLLGERYVSKSGLPVVNVAGCPTHPNWVTETLTALALKQFSAEDMDPLGRPRTYADRLVHHGCTRNEYYEYKASAEKPSDSGCLMENLGCMGTLAHADCNTRLWNGEGSCTRGGYACIGCTDPGFEEPGHAFLQTPKIAGIPVGLPSDMPKAWFMVLSSLSKSATPRRLKENAVSDHVVTPPALRKTK